MDLKKYVDRKKFSVYNGFRIVGESRKEERRGRKGFSEVLERWA